MLRLQCCAARVPNAKDGSRRPTFGQQPSDYGATGPSGCAGDQNFEINHGKKRRVAI